LKDLGIKTGHIIQIIKKLESDFATKYSITKSPSLAKLLSLDVGVEEREVAIVKKEKKHKKHKKNKKVSKEKKKHKEWEEPKRLEPNLEITNPQEPKTQVEHKPSEPKSPSGSDIKSCTSETKTSLPTKINKTPRTSSGSEPKEKRDKKSRKTSSADKSKASNPTPVTKSKSEEPRKREPKLFEYNQEKFSEWAASIGGNELVEIFNKEAITSGRILCSLIENKNGLKELKIKQGHLIQIMEKYDKDVPIENRKHFKLEDSGKPQPTTKNRRSSLTLEKPKPKKREIASYNTEQFFTWSDSISPEVTEIFKKSAITNGETLVSIYDIEGKQGLKELELKPGHLIHVLKKLM